MNQHQSPACRDYFHSSRCSPTRRPLVCLLLWAACAWLIAPSAIADEATVWQSPTLFLWAGQEAPEPGESKLDEPLVTDRPDFTEASTTVGRGVAQVEMGYTFFYDDAPDARFVGHTYPEMLWRIGVLADWLELRISYTAASESTAVPLLPEENVSGGQDLYLGIKLALTNQDGWLPEMALTPQMLVPTGSVGLTAGEVLPGLNWLYGWDINDWLSCGASTQANMRTDIDGSNYVEFAQSFTINYQLTERIGAYTEWFVLAPAGATTVLPENYFDGGFTFRLTDNIQFDIRAGVGLNDPAVDFFSGSGLAVRF